MSNPMNRKGRKVLKLGITRPEPRQTELTVQWLTPVQDRRPDQAAVWTPVRGLDLPVIAF